MKMHLIAALIGLVSFAHATEREIATAFSGNLTEEEVMTIRKSMDHYILEDVQIESATFPSIFFYLAEKIRDSSEYKRTGKEFSFSISITEKVIYPKDVTFSEKSISLPELIDTICTQGDFYWSCGKDIMLVSEKPKTAEQGAAANP
jgi:hypothetical protein